MKYNVYKCHNGKADAEMGNVSGSVLRCEWLRSDVVNYAMQQNFVPVVQRLTLYNDSTTDITQVKVQIKSDPEFAAVWTKLSL